MKEGKGGWMERRGEGRDGWGEAAEIIKGGDRVRCVLEMGRCKTNHEETWREREKEGGRKGLRPRERERERSGRQKSGGEGGRGGDGKDVVVLGSVQMIAPALPGERPLPLPVCHPSILLVYASLPRGGSCVPG